MMLVGKNKFFDGKSCKYGHISERYVSNGCCVMCARQRSILQWRKGFSKKYYEANKEKIKAARRERYRIHRLLGGNVRLFTNKSCKYGHIAERYTSNGCCVACMVQHGRSLNSKEYARKYYQDNKEKIKAARRMRYKSKV